LTIAENIKEEINRRGRKDYLALSGGRKGKQKISF